MATHVAKVKPKTRTLAKKNWNEFCDLRAVYDVCRQVDQEKEVTSETVNDAVEDIFHRAPQMQSSDFLATFEGRSRSDRAEVLAICLEELIDFGVLGVYRKEGEIIYKVRLMANA